MRTKFSFTMGLLPGDKKDLMTRAVEDAQSLLDAASGGGYNALAHTKWLGSGISPTDVQTYTTRMGLLAAGVLFTLGYQNNPDSFAWCNADKYRGSQEFGAEYPYAPQCTMMFCTNFFSDKVSRGERAQTLLHELTHLALASTDEKVTVGGKEVDAYGDLCATLLSQAPERAKKNADNWGFYFAAYRSGLGWSEKDSMYLEVEEIAAARGKRF